MSRTLFATVSLSVVAGGLLFGQTPPPSPRDTTLATVGSANVLIDYGRPSKRGRVIFGELVPSGEVWRTGANAATTLVTDKPLMIGTLAVPPGTYTLYTLPDRTGWKLIVNRQTGQWGTEYDASKDLGRVEMTVNAVPAVVEKFVIKIADGMLRMEWDKTVAAVAIRNQ